MSHYDTILQELDRRTAALVQKHAGRLSEQEVLRQVFADDPEIYERYRRSSANQPLPEPQSRQLPAPTGIEAQVLRKAAALESQGIAPREAYSLVFKQEPALYERYTARSQC